MNRKPPIPLLSLALVASICVPAFAQSSATAADGFAQQAIASADLSKTSREVPTSSEGQRLYNDGIRLYDAAKFSDALSAFKEATRISPDDAQAFFMLGLSEARLQLYKDSVDSFRRVVRLRPDWAEAHFRLGVVSHVSGRKTLATDAYSSLRKMNSPLANTLFRVIREEKNRNEAAQVNIGDEFWSYPERSKTSTGTAPEKNAVPKGVAPSVANATVSQPNPTPDKPVPADPSPANATSTNTTPANEPAASDLILSTIYRIGVGDVLDIRVLNTASPRSTLYTVLDGGLIDFPAAGGSISAAGLTADELQVTIAAELKRRAVEENARVSVGVRQYASHAVNITGLVSSPGIRFLRREAVPLYAIMTESQARQDAGRVAIIRAGNEIVIDLSNSGSLNFLIKPGDLISVLARPQQFYYIGGKINYPGQKSFQSGLTLLQAILAAGGASRPGDNVVEISRENGSGRLGTTRYKLKEIKTGQVPDPKIQAGDRIDVLK